MIIVSILSSNRVAIEVPVGSKKALLEEFSNVFGRAGDQLVAKDIFPAFLARELLGSTALGGGVAIPHARVSTCLTPLGAFIRTSNPVDFDAKDGRPVDLFFALCVPEDATQDHLNLVDELARRFSDDRYLARLRKLSDTRLIFSQLVS